MAQKTGIKTGMKVKPPKPVTEEKEVLGMFKSLPVEAVQLVYTSLQEDLVSHDPRNHRPYTTKEWRSTPESLPTSFIYKEKKDDFINEDLVLIAYTKIQDAILRNDPEIEAFVSIIAGEQQCIEQQCIRYRVLDEDRYELEHYEVYF